MCVSGLLAPGERSEWSSLRPYWLLALAVSGSRMCFAAWGFSVSSTDVPSYAAARVPFGVLRRSMCSGSLAARLDAAAGELPESCLESGWAYCCGAGRWARLCPSGAVLWRRSKAREGAGGMEVCGPSGEGSCDWRTIVMVGEAVRAALGRMQGGLARGRRAGCAGCTCLQAVVRGRRSVDDYTARLHHSWRVPMPSRSRRLSAATNMSFYAWPRVCYARMASYWRVASRDPGGFGGEAVAESARCWGGRVRALARGGDVWAGAAGGGERGGSSMRAGGA